MEHIHNFGAKVIHSSLGAAVFATRFCISGSVHIRQQGNIFNPQRIDNDVTVDVPTMITMDYYLEFVFPEMNVRYIAVNDNEDTDKGLSDFVPFKNLFNDNYS